MGNIIQSSSRLELEKDYRIVKEGHYDLTLLEELGTKNQYCLKCFTFNSVEGLEACVEKMNMKKRISHQHLLGIKNVYSRSENTFCSNLHKVFVIIEYPFRTLQEQIEERRANWDYFSETEIWSILYSCSMALNYLYSTNLTHECLTSNRIYIETSGLIKISDPGLMNYVSNPVTYMTKSNRQHVYLSPQQIAQLPSNSVDNQMGLEAADVFVLGMIILEAIHLHGMEEVYDNGVSYKQLSAKINTTGAKYSSNLRAILERMLANDVQERITFEEIETIIENENLDEQSDSSSPSTLKKSSQSYRKPLDSLPPQNNMQCSRMQQIRPTKTPVGKREANPQYVQSLPAHSITTIPQPKSQQNYKAFAPNYHSGVQKFEPLTFIPPPILPPTLTSHLFTPNYNTPHSPNYYTSTTNYSSNYQFSNLLSLNSPSNNPGSTVPTRNSNISKPLEPPQLSQMFSTKLPTLTKPTIPLFQPPTVPLSNYTSFPPSSISFPYRNQISHFEPKPAYQPVNSPLPYPEYKYQPLQRTQLQNISLQNETSPVQRLNATDQAQEIEREAERPHNVEPNSTIAEVTESQVSGLESPEKEQNNSRSRLQYVNEDSQSGGHYEGYKLNGKKHGFGRLYYQDGGYYEGEWKNNKMNGFAKLYYQSGDIAYEGYWMNDKLHGKGKVFNDHPVNLHTPFDYKDFTGLDDYWLYYDGEFSTDAKQGFGTIKLTNGEVFEGEFDKDVIEGRGKFYTLDGEIISGVWKQNRLFETK